MPASNDLCGERRWNVFRRRPLHRGDGVLRRFLYLLESAHIDLTDALARYAELVGTVERAERKKVNRQSYQAFSRTGGAAPLPAITAGNGGMSTSSLVTSGPAP